MSDICLNKSKKINLIIGTYAGKYYKFNTNNTTANNDKQYYLKYNLSLINKNVNNLTQITIMKPKINKEHSEIPDYYNFDNIDISNIKNKIKIYECENIGISYGQFFNAVFIDLEFDYYIFIEDDYFPFIDNFDDCLINMIDNYNLPTYLCSFIDLNKVVNLNAFENFFYDNISKIKVKSYLNKYNFNNKSINIPDFSLGILNKSAVINLKNTYKNIYNILELYRIQTTQNWVHQVLFGYTLKIANIELVDYNKIYLNIFFESSNQNLYLCNIQENYTKWKMLKYNGSNYKLPLFLPIDILYPSNYKEDIDKLINYINIDSSTTFIEYLKRYNNIKIQNTFKNLVKNTNKTICIYINKKHNDYMPFFLYIKSLEYILKNIFTNIILTESVEIVQKIKPQILFIFSISLFDVIHCFYPNQLKFIINTEYYNTWNIEEKLKILNNINNIHFLEYNILNIELINQKYDNIKVLYVPQLYHTFLNFYYQKNIGQQNNQVKDIDVLFYGNTKIERRQKILNELSHKINLKIVFNEKNDVLCKLINRSKIVLNIYAMEDNKPFDYYRNIFVLANNNILVSEYPRDINVVYEKNLENIENFLQVPQYNDIVNRIETILYKYNDKDFINNIITKQIEFLKKNVMSLTFYENFSKFIS